MPLSRIMYDNIQKLLYARLQQSMQNVTQVLILFRQCRVWIV